MLRERETFVRSCIKWIVGRHGMGMESKQNNRKMRYNIIIIMNNNFSTLFKRAAAAAALSSVDLNIFPNNFIMHQWIMSRRWIPNVNCERCAVYNILICAQIFHSILQLYSLRGKRACHTFHTPRLCRLTQWKRRKRRLSNPKPNRIRLNV